MTYCTKGPIGPGSPPPPTIRLAILTLYDSQVSFPYDLNIHRLNTSVAIACWKYSTGGGGGVEKSDSGAVRSYCIYVTHNVLLLTCTVTFTLIPVHVHVHDICMYA